ncbi:hypothetical protein Tco_0916229 [Tanacetum coccineum]
MGDSSSQPRKDPAMSPINAFPIEELYSPQFLDSFQDNTGYWKEPNPHESPVEQVATSPTKKKKATRNRQKRTIQSDDAPRKHGNLRRQAGFWCEVLQYIESKTKQYGRRTYDMKSGAKDEYCIQMAMVHRVWGLMVTEMTAQEKEQREIFLEIKRREVKCREREAVTQECRQEQEDTGFYLQPYDHLTRDRRKAMDEIKAKIKAKYNLQY